MPGRENEVFIDQCPGTERNSRDEQQCSVRMLLSIRLSPGDRASRNNRRKRDDEYNEHGKQLFTHILFPFVEQG
jgi:hypothetical protein